MLPTRVTEKRQTERERAKNRICIINISIFSDEPFNRDIFGFNGAFHDQNILCVHYIDFIWFVTVMKWLAIDQIPYIQSSFDNIRESINYNLHIFGNKPEISQRQYLQFVKYLKCWQLFYLFATNAYASVFSLRIFSIFVSTVYFPFFGFYHQCIKSIWFCNQIEFVTPISRWRCESFIKLDVNTNDICFCGFFFNRPIYPATCSRVHHLLYFPSKIHWMTFTTYQLRHLKIVSSFLHSIPRIAFGRWFNKSRKFTCHVKIAFS